MAEPIAYNRGVDDVGADCRQRVSLELAPRLYYFALRSSSERRVGANHRPTCCVTLPRYRIGHFASHDSDQQRRLVAYGACVKCRCVVYTFPFWRQAPHHTRCGQLVWCTLLRQLASSSLLWNSFASFGCMSPNLFAAHIVTSDLCLAEHALYPTIFKLACRVGQLSARSSHWLSFTHKSGRQMRRRYGANACRVADPFLGAVRNRTSQASAFVEGVVYASRLSLQTPLTRNLRNWTWLHAEGKTCEEHADDRPWSVLCHRPRPADLVM